MTGFQKDTYETSLCLPQALKLSTIVTALDTIIVTIYQEETIDMSNLYQDTWTIMEQASNILGACKFKVFIANIANVSFSNILN